MIPLKTVIFGQFKLLRLFQKFTKLTAFVASMGLPVSLSSTSICLGFGKLLETLKQTIEIIRYSLYFTIFTFLCLFLGFKKKSFFANTELEDH